MSAWICETCGVQYSDSPQPPDGCPVCEDERQYVGPRGQRWTTRERQRDAHRADIRELEPRLTGIGSEPEFAIGQRALLVQTPAGNILWDCISLLDDVIVQAVEARGGLAAIAISHPHFYGSLGDWSRAFGDVPVYLHEDDREWLMQPGANVVHWAGGTQELPGGLTLVRCGGHFEGAAVLHWPGGAEERGVLLTGDVMTVVADQRYVSFMRSYPNLIPLPAASVHRMVAAVEPFAFDRIYGGWYGRLVERDAKAAVRRSADRYVRAIES